MQIVGSVDIEFQEGITDALLDYENSKNKSFVDYDSVFKK